MAPYYLLIAIPCVTAFVQMFLKRRDLRYRNNMPLVIFFGIYLLLIALRSQAVGSDTVVYADLFEKIGWTPWKEIFSVRETEHGFSIYNKLLSLISEDPQILLIVTALITVIPLAILYYKESENALVSMALFLVFPVFIMNFSGLRQAIAIAIGSIAYFAVKRKKWLLFIALVLLAWTFHQSALILLALYPLYYAKLRPIHLPVLFSALVVVYVLRTPIYNAVLPFLGEDYLETYGNTGETGAYTMLILFFLFTVYAFLMPNEKLMDGETNGLRNFLVLALFMQVFTAISPITMRMNYYFIIFIPLLIPKVTNRCIFMEKRLIQLINVVFISFFILYYLIKANRVDSLNIYPYIPFWK